MVAEDQLPVVGGRNGAAGDAGSKTGVPGSLVEGRDLVCAGELGDMNFMRVSSAIGWCEGDGIGSSLRIGAVPDVGGDELRGIRRNQSKHVGIAQGV